MEKLYDDYYNLLRETYIMPENLVKEFMFDSDEALKVSQSKDAQLVYVSKITLVDLIDIVSPLTAKDLAACGITFEQFEKDYKPQYWTPDKNDYCDFIVCI